MSVVPPQARALLREHARERRIALFGGTFDPIHIGHLAVARAAERRFHLDEIHFIPTGRPPHKHRSGMASYADRYAMVALACADHPRFIASLAESGAGHSGREIFYSVDTVRHFKQKFHGAGVHLYFLLGADSFLHIPTWKDYETLLGLCDFIVASRPGFQCGRAAAGDSAGTVRAAGFGARAAGPARHRAAPHDNLCARHGLQPRLGHRSPAPPGSQRVDSWACAAARRGIHYQAGPLPVTEKKGFAST